MRQFSLGQSQQEQLSDSLECKQLHDKGLRSQQSQAFVWFPLASLATALPFTPTQKNKTKFNS